MILGAWSIIRIHRAAWAEWGIGLVEETVWGGEASNGSGENDTRTVFILMLEE